MNMKRNMFVLLEIAGVITNKIYADEKDCFSFISDCFML